MLYSDYYKKISKLGIFFQKVKRYRVPIAIVTMLIIAIIAALLSARGTVYDKKDCPPVIEYGSDVGYSAGAFLSGIKYEYREIDGEWSDKKPTRIGEYQVRAVSHSVGGAPRYGAVHTFTIEPKPISVAVRSGGVYGDNPGVSAELAYGDVIECNSYDYDSYATKTPTVTADIDAVVIKSVDGEDVTENYALTAQPTEIELVPREITVTVASNISEYDGKTKRYGGHEITAGTLAHGDALVAIEDTALTDAGDVALNPKFVIMHEGGEDVTSNYSIDAVAGKISIAQRIVRITTGSGTREYDGKEFSCTDFTVDESTPIVEGHRIALGIAARQTDAGETENILSFKVLDAVGVDVSRNYSLVLTTGKISVTKREVAVTTSDETMIYDGAEHVYSNFEAQRIVNGHIAAAISAQTVLVPAEYENKVIIEVKTLDGTDVSSNYSFVYDYGTITVQKRPMTVVTPSVEREYTAVELLTDINAVGGITEALCDGHSYDLAPASGQTNVGSMAANVVLAIKDGKNEDVTDNYKITYTTGTLTVTKRPVTIKSGSTSFEYDGAAHNFEFVESVGNVVSNQRVVVVGNTEITRVNLVSGVNTPIDNVLEYIIMNGDIDVTSNYEITPEYGTLTVTPRTIKVKPIDVRKVYDDTELTVENADVGSAVRFECMDNTSIPQTDVGVATGYSGSKTNVIDNAESTIDGFGVVCGEDDVTYCYDIVLCSGAITIEKRPITVESASNIPREYDGTSLTEQSLVNPDGIDLVDSHRIDVEYSAYILDAGETKNTFTAKIFKNDTENVTENYHIAPKYGTLKILKRKIIVRPIDVEKDYDDKPLTVENYAGSMLDKTERFIVESGSVVDGETMRVTGYDGSRTDAGTDVGTIKTFEILRSDFDIAAKNYDVTKANGKITIRPLRLTVTPHANNWEYDGLEHSEPNFDYTGTVVEGQTFTMKDCPKIIHVGEKQNNLTVDIKKGNAVKTQNYDIAYNYDGKNIKITARRITVRTKTGNKVYNGEEQSFTEFEITGTTHIAETDVAKYDESKPTVKIKNVKNSSDVRDERNNEFCVKILNKTDESENRTNNYVISYSYGKFGLLPRPVRYRCGDISHTYDDSSHSDIDGCSAHTGQNSVAPVFTTDGDIVMLPVDGHKAKPIEDTVPRLQNVGTKENTYSVKIFDGDNVDVSDNYTIYIAGGLIEITRRTLSFETASKTWVYDGKPHSDGTLVANSGLIENQKPIAVGAPTITDVCNHGTETVYCDSYHVENRFTVTVKCENHSNCGASRDSDVTGNYVISPDVKYGELRVLPRPIVITTKSGEWTYDGTTRMMKEYDSIAKGSINQYGAAVRESYPDIVYNDDEPAILNGHIAEVIDGTGVKNHLKPNGEITNEDNYLELKIKEGDIDKTRNYTLCRSDIDSRSKWFAVWNCGKLKINPVELNYCTAGAEKYFDAKHLLKWDGAYVYRSDRPEVKRNIAGSETVGAIAIGKVPIKTSFVSFVKDENGSDEQINFNIYAIMFPQESGDNGLELDQIGVPNGQDFEDRKYLGNYVIKETGNTVGRLTIKPIKVKITTGSYEGYYDGDEHDNPEASYTVIESGKRDSSGAYALPDDFELIVRTTGKSVKDVDKNNGAISNEYALFARRKVDPLEGDAANEVSRKLCDGLEIDGSGVGSLKVNKRPILVKTSNGKWVYDGRYHMNKTVSIKPVAPLGTALAKITHGVSVTEYESIKYAGSKINSVTVRIYDSANDNEDISGNYIVTNDFGSLEIERRNIAVVTGTNTFEYTGEEQRFKEIKISDKSPYTMVDGDVFDYADELFKSVKERGEKKDNMVQFLIIGKNGDVVTESYAIVPEYGVIAISGQSEQPPDPDNPSEPPPEQPSETIKDYEGNPNIPMLDILSDYQGVITLKTRSYGDYIAGKDSIDCWDAEIGKYKYNQTLSNGGGMNMLTTLALQNSAAAYRLKIKIKDGRVANTLPYYLSFNGEIPLQAGDVVYSGVDALDYEYVMRFFDYDILYSGAPPALSGEYSAIEEEYRRFVAQKYLALPVDTQRKIIDDFIAKDDTLAAYFAKADKTTADLVDIIRYVAYRVKNLTPYNKAYDKALEKESDIAVAFLCGKADGTRYEGVCRHYSAAATVLFRALGIPARYCTGIVAQSSGSGNWEEVKSSNLHAWVETYIVGSGWVRVEVTGSSLDDNPDSGNNNPAEPPNSDEEKKKAFDLTLKPIDIIREGFGTIKAKNVLVDTEGKLDGLLKDGLTYSVTVSGEITHNAGSDLSSEIKEGESTITSLEVFMKGVTVYKYIDGVAVVTSGQLSVDIVPGRLALTGDKKIVRVTAHSINVTYNGEAQWLTAAQYSVTSMPSEYGDCKFEVIGADVSQAAAGYKTIEDVRKLLGSRWFRVTRGDLDVTDRFEMEYYPLVDIELTENDYETLKSDLSKIKVINVKKIKLKLTSRTYNVAYSTLDGRPLTMQYQFDSNTVKPQDAVIIDGKPIEGHTIEYVFTASVECFIGNYEKNKFTATIVKEGGVDVSGNYEITYKFGSLEITA